MAILGDLAASDPLIAGRSPVIERVQSYYIGLVAGVAL